MQRAKEAGVKRNLPAQHRYGQHRPAEGSSRRNPHCKPMVGLHPTSVKENYQAELAMIFKELDAGNYAAVGEIGMDLYWDKTHIKEQRKAFGIQIEKAKEMGLPIVIHCRDAFDDIFEVLDAYNDEKLYGIFHCFTGSLKQARRAIDLGFQLGIGGVVTFKNGGLAVVVKDLEIKHLVLETDAPFLAPAPFRGKRNEPSYLKYVIEKVAEVKGVSVEEVDRQTTKNAKEVFEPVRN